MSLRQRTAVLYLESIPIIENDLNISKYGGHVWDKCEQAWYDYAITKNYQPKRQQYDAEHLWDFNARIKGNDTRIEVKSIPWDYGFTKIPIYHAASNTQSWPLKQLRQVTSGGPRGNEHGYYVIMRPKIKDSVIFETKMYKVDKNEINWSIEYLLFLTKIL